MILTTPKLNQAHKQSLYPYYAGYAYGFVHEALSTYAKDGGLVLDPWSGTGLTSVVAKQLGCQSLGIDINPVMTTIAKANNISPELSPSISAIKIDIIKKFKFAKNNFREDDALNLWFDRPSVGLLRSFERIINKLLVCAQSNNSIFYDDKNLSSLASFFYISLFKVVKKLVKIQFSTSNPTWIKIAKSEEEKISVNKGYIVELFDEFLEEQLYLINNIEYFNAPSELVKFSTASSRKIPLSDNTVDQVLTSPPYCTRIDYAVAMRPELAVLGIINNAGFKELRAQTIGAPIIRQQELEPNVKWGKSCNEFLNQVKEHPSAASQGYYYSNFLQYFDDMYCSFKEISRVCKKGTNVGIVVQDSFYKDLHIDLPIFFEEMLLNFDFIKTKDTSFKSNSFDNINPKSAKYHKKQKSREFFLNFIN